jgi:hypothetical protein
MSKSWPFGRGGFGRTDGPPPTGNGKPTMDLSRGRLSAQERGLLHHLSRLAAAHPGRAVAVLDVLAQYGAYRDRDRGSERDIRQDFDAALGSLHSLGLIEWQGDVVRLKP